MEKTHMYNTLEAQHGEPSKRCQDSLPSLELALAVSKEREVSFWWPLISGASSIPGCQGVKSLKDVLEKALGVGKY